MAAANTVLNTNELFEMILLYLPARDVILLQTTFSLWRATFRSSKSIRIKLFRQPSARAAVAWIQDAENTPPILKKFFRFHRTIPKHINRLGTIADVKPNEDFAVTAAFNELIFRSNRPGRLTHRIDRGETVFIRDSIRRSLFRDMGLLDCDDMYLTDPPAKGLHIMWDCKPECSRPLVAKHGATVMNLTGITVGELRKAVVAECSNGCCTDSEMEIDFKRVRQPSRDWSVGLLFPTESDYEEARRVDQRGTALVSGPS